MPAWAGKWRGGRYYLDDSGKRVFFIESNRKGVPRAIQLETHDEELAKAQLAQFRSNPATFLRLLKPPEPELPPEAVTITPERVNLYLASISNRARDYYNAKRADLYGWATWRDSEGRPLDLRTVDKKTLRVILDTFKGDGKDRRRTGGFKRRAESLNCFANFLVREGDGLKEWSPLTVMPNQRPAQTRAEQVAYSPEEIRAAWLKLEDQALKDVLHLRVATGMHYTEIQQLVGARLLTGPLPDKHPVIGSGFIRAELDNKAHEIRGVVQIRQKTKPRHRVSVNALTLEAALRLRAGAPSRFDVYNAFVAIGMVPSNLRHTYTTLRGKGRIIHYDEGGVSLDEVAELLGHRVGSKMTGSRYDKLQVPPMMKLPLDWS
jgi:integrase